MSLQQFTPTTNKSVLVYNQFKGFPLESGKTYRENNINKANSILALAVQNGHNAYLFEIYEDINTQKITDSFKQIDPTFKYLKLVLDSHIQLLLFTRLNEELATTIIWNNTEDYGLKESIADVKNNAVQAAGITYQLAQHYLTPKQARKQKQYCGSDLTHEEKSFSLMFELTPKVTC